VHQIVLILHLFSATIWVGGHCILCFRYLPKSIKEKKTSLITDFEKQYEVIGIPALLILVITGILMAYNYNIPITTWFSFSNSIEKVISVKLMLLISTLLLATHARIFIIPRLSIKTLPLMAFHIILITTIAISMLVIGTFVRIGGI